MKKNIILLLCFFSFLSIAYYFEEFKPVKAEKEKFHKTALIKSESLGELVRVGLPKAEIFKKGEFYYLKNGLKASDISIEKFFDKLQSIRVRRFMSESNLKGDVFTKNGSPIVFEFKNKTLRFYLGDKLNFDQTFYMKVVEGDVVKIAIAEDISAMVGIHSKKDHHKSDQKYNNLTSLFNLSNDFFVDKKVVDVDFNQLKKVTLNNNRAQSTVINLKEKKTIPAAIKGIRYFNAYFMQLKNDILSLHGDRVIFPFKKKSLAVKIASANIEDEKGTVITLNLYNKYDNKTGYFLKSTQKDAVFHLNQKQVSWFFYNVQDFWEKVAIPSDLKMAPGFRKFKMKFAKKKYQLELPFDRDFKVVNTKAGVKDVPRTDSFKALFGLLTKAQANRVDKITKNSMLPKSSLFQLELLKKNYEFYKKNKELIVVNREDNYALRYYVGSETPIGKEIEDYFDKP
jgi:hypothetical protein